MCPEYDDRAGQDGAEHREFDRTLDSIGWGMFFILLGGIWLVPESMVPEGLFLIGLGVIFLGLNIVKYVAGRAVSPFWVVIGLILLIIGISDSLGMDIPVIPIIVIIIGVSMIVKPLIGKK